MIPREELAGFPICPYAKQSIQNKTYNIVISTVNDIQSVMEGVDIQKYQVVIIVIQDYMDYSIEFLKTKTIELNNSNRGKDLVILDNDPRTPFIVNGITTTFDKSYLYIVQQLSDLNDKSSALMKTNYYSVWTNQQIEEVVLSRTKI
jgi:hypothetical protein